MCLLGFGTDMHNAQAGTATFFFGYEPNPGLFFTKQRLILCKTIILELVEVLEP